MTIKKMDGPDDPRRCQGVMPTVGQCHNQAVEHSEYCIMHGGNMAAEAARKQSISNYRLAKWQARLERQLDSPHIKSLRDEIGLSRMVLEEVLNRCATPFDLLTNAQKISSLTAQIASLVEKCHRLEGSMGQLLDKKTMIQMANTFIDIIAAEELPEAILERISERIMESLAA